MCERSALDSDETESEHDEEELAALQVRKQTLAVLSEIKPTLGLFQRYLQWFQFHDVKTAAQLEEEARLRLQQQRIKEEALPEPEAPMELSDLLPQEAEESEEEEEEELVQRRSRRQSQRTTMQ